MNQNVFIRITDKMFQHPQGSTITKNSHIATGKKSTSSFPALTSPLNCAAQSQGRSTQPVTSAVVGRREWRVHSASQPFSAPTPHGATSYLSSYQVLKKQHRPDA